MISRIRHGLSTLGSLIWKFFINGLLAILPLTITIAILHFFYKLLRSWIDPIHAFVTQHPTLKTFPPYIEVFILLIGIFSIGAFLNIVLLRTIIHRIEKIIDKLPLARSIYPSIKQLINAFSGQEKDSFKKVVLVEFPKKGVYSLGFLTSELSTQLVPTAREPFVTVFVPTTPNPTSGFFLILNPQEIIETDLNRQEALSLIISGGIVQPERYKK